MLQRAAEDPNGMRVAIALASSSLFVVAQHFAGSLVDQMYAAAGRAGHNLVAVRSIGRRRFGQPHLNVRAGPDASEDELGHWSTLTPPPRRALPCLNFGAPHGPGRHDPAGGLFREPLILREDHHRSRLILELSDDTAAIGRPLSCQAVPIAPKAGPRAGGNEGPRAPLIS